MSTQSIPDGCPALKKVEPEESTSRPDAFGAGLAYVKAVDELIRLTRFVRELQGLLLSGSQPLVDWSRLCRGPATVEAEIITVPMSKGEYEAWKKIKRRLVEFN